MVISDSAPGLQAGSICAAVLDTEGIVPPPLSLPPSPEYLCGLWSYAAASSLLQPWE